MTRSSLIACLVSPWYSLCFLNPPSSALSMTSSTTLLSRFSAFSSFVYLGMRPRGSHPPCGLDTYATGFGAGARPRGSGQV